MAFTQIQKPTEKIYTPLMEIPRAIFLHCAQVLPNKVQCPHGGDFQVLEKLSSSETRVYQLCRKHVTLQKLADKLALQDYQIGPGKSIQEPPSTELPAPLTSWEALQASQSPEFEPNNVYPPPIVLMGKQEGQQTVTYGTGDQVLAENLTQETQETEDTQEAQAPTTVTKKK
jgi:hypothetical protein